MKNNNLTLFFSLLVTILILAGLIGFALWYFPQFNNQQNQQAANTEDTENTENQPVSKATVKFYCSSEQYLGKEIPVTIVESSSQNQAIALIRWKPDNDYFGEEWTPQKRCEEVAQRFQTIHDRDGLEFIVADEAQWTNAKYNVVCGIKQKYARCEEDDLLFTLEKEDDPNQVLNELMAFRNDPNINPPLSRGDKPPENFAQGKRDHYNIGELLETKEQSKPAF
jgi:hypothetical protein